MIKVFCDHCGSKMDISETMYGPLVSMFASTKTGCCETGNKRVDSGIYEDSVQQIIVAEGAETRTLELCRSCKKEIYNYIFNIGKYKADD